jgi:hypothetical protein
MGTSNGEEMHENTWLFARLGNWNLDGCVT